MNQVRIQVLAEHAYAKVKRLERKKPTAVLVLMEDEDTEGLWHAICYDKDKETEESAAAKIAKVVEYTHKNFIGV